MFLPSEALEASKGDQEDVVMLIESISNSYI